MNSIQFKRADSLAFITSILVYIYDIFTSFYLSMQNGFTLTTSIQLSCGIISIILSAFIYFSYKGKKYSQVQPVIGMRYFSIRFALIVFSFIGGQKIYFYEALSKTYLVSSLPTKMIKTDDQE